MNFEERLEAIAQHVEVMASMQLETEKSVQDTGKQLKRLTREVRLFRHFVLSMGANIESRLLNLEDHPDDDKDEDK